MYDELIPSNLTFVENHIKNIYAEIPYQVDKHKWKNVSSVIQLFFNDKDAWNSANYRKCQLIVANCFKENISDSRITEIMITLCKIQKILNLPDCDWTSYLQSSDCIFLFFLHELYIKINLRGNLKKHSPRKLFGSHCHSIIWRICWQYKIISQRSVNTENEEETKYFDSNPSKRQVELNLF